ncbi:septum site-determining protein Ssd [Mycobacterium sp. 1274761.0]|uniref:septum site-determining protein Ssd n=1 Tax=Mycobacterium sp. 1274761.0 TaxID=1834077 RepID=UPI0008016BE0|nr:septum site-determining protein Ssd [Mycobacterium sp. 1274761.0]OBK72855.1 AAA family ATPase [Mycobacterium sp. 1274761.0]
MTTSNGVLAMLADAALRDEVDRVAAAAGVPVVHVARPPSRQAWSGALAVLLDTARADGCAALPRRGFVLMLCRGEPDAAEWQAAVAVGAQRVMTLPSDEANLVAAISEAAAARRDGERRGPVVAVMAARGGAGASVFATALARAAGDALLVDADPWSGGMDLVVGTEDKPGLRWPDLAVEHGRLDFAALRQALPRLDGLSVLSGVRSGNDVDAGPLAAVVDAGRRGGVTVVCDLPRRMTRAVEFTLDAADLVVLVVTADVGGCAAATAVAPTVSAINANVGLVVRGPSPAGLRPTEVARIVELPLLAAVRAQPGLAMMLERGGLRIPPRSPLGAAARRVMTLLARHPLADAA